MTFKTSEAARNWGQRGAEKKRVAGRITDDRVAELLANGADFKAIASRLTMTPDGVRRSFLRIRNGLGPQAI